MTENYVAICPNCHALCACASGKLPPRELAKIVGGWIRDGLIVEQASNERIRAEFAGCRCKAEMRQKALL